HTFVRRRYVTTPPPSKQKLVHMRYMLNKYASLEAGLRIQNYEIPYGGFSLHENHTNTRKSI
ncbi:3490_t:CDS:1, partial [Paraglomus occultum]